MKKLNIYISEDSLLTKTISDFDKQIPESTRNSSGFQVVYNEVTACIDDFISRAKKVAQVGTTIHLEREIQFDDFGVLIIIDSPKKRGVLDKLKRAIGRS